MSLMFKQLFDMVVTSVSLYRHYILGTSVVRIILHLYMFGCPHNAVNWEKSQPNGVLILVLYVAVQVGILYTQEAFGPRCFVPTGVSVD